MQQHKPIKNMNSTIFKTIRSNVSHFTRKYLHTYDQPIPFHIFKHITASQCKYYVRKIPKNLFERKHVKQWHTRKLFHKQTSYNSKPLPFTTHARKYHSLLQNFEPRRPTLPHHTAHVGASWSDFMCENCSRNH